MAEDKRSNNSGRPKVSPDEKKNKSVIAYLDSVEIRKLDEISEKKELTRSKMARRYILEGMARDEAKS